MDKIVNDSILGLIILKPHITALMDTLQFQRLRNISQLGLLSFIYPTKNHSRFEHCIGTYWLASRLVTKIKEQLEKDNEDDKSLISDEEVKCVEIAALYHDIGHGPFSHTWDRKILPALCKNSESHENKFSEIWKDVRKLDHVKLMLLENNLTESHEKLVDRLIQGKYQSGDKEILFAIVSNSESGMDVDKWDYLARDSSQLGQMTSNYSIDIDRMIHFARAIKNDNGKWEIAFRDKEHLNIMNVFLLRYHLYKVAYFHVKSLAIDEMMIDGVKRCIENKILDVDQINKTSWLLQNTDSFFWEISLMGNIKEFNNILCRKFYKILVKGVKNEIVKDPKDNLLSYLRMENVNINKIRIIFLKFMLGNEPGNPILKIPFYTKNCLKSSFYYKKENLIPSLNLNFDESNLVIFSIDENVNDPELQSIKSLAQIWLKENNWILE